MRDIDWQDLFNSWEQLSNIVARNALLLVGDDGNNEVFDYRLPSGNGRSKLQAVFWLAKEMGMLARPELLFSVLEKIENDEMPLYNRFFLKKKSGGFREICAPDRDLKKIQRRLNKLFSLSFVRQKNVLGFSGGSIIEAIQPHLSAKVLLGVDCKDAFTMVKAEDLLKLFLDGRKYRVNYDSERKQK
ncbi:MAG: hypothetical protein V1801_02845 [Candidatus Falkowbacteria bacterium]